MKKAVENILWWKGHIPKKDIKYITSHRKEAEPYLIDIIKEVLKRPKYYAKQKDYMGHKVAMYLLAQFRCTMVFEDMLEIFSLEDEVAYELLGYNTTYDESRILASVYNGKLELLKKEIEREDVHEVHKTACIDTLKILALQAVLDRKTVLGYYRDLMSRATTKKESEVECAAFNSIELYPGEIMGDIERLYREKKLDETVLFRCSFDQALDMGKKRVLEIYRMQEHNSYIKDIINEGIFWEEISGEI